MMKASQWQPDSFLELQSAASDV